MRIIVDSIAELEQIAELTKTQQRRPRVMLCVTGFSVTSSARGDGTAIRRSSRSTARKP
jgi:hypothetical protein